MAKKAIVLSSGGVDSTTCVALAVKELGAENVSTVSIFYGQKHKKEIACARKIADYYGLKHYEYDLSKIMQYSDCSLLEGSSQKISHKSYAKQVTESKNGMVSTYVPFRNGLMLSCAAALAQSLYLEDDCEIYLGAHADDAAGNAYADCSIDFVNTMGQAISIGTYGKVKLVAPFAGNNKAEVVKKGLELGVPYELTWSCYEGGEKPCCSCGTCLDRILAFEANGTTDPLLLQ